MTWALLVLIWWILTASLGQNDVFLAHSAYTDIATKRIPDCGFSFLLLNHDLRPIETMSGSFLHCLAFSCDYSKFSCCVVLLIKTWSIWLSALTELLSQLPTASRYLRLSPAYVFQVLRPISIEMFFEWFCWGLWLTLLLCLRSRLFLDWYLVVTRRYIYLGEVL